MKKWNIHFCKLDPECHGLDAPNRVSANTPWFYWAAALTPSSKFAGRIDMEVWHESGKAVPIEKDRWTMFKRHQD